MRGQVPLLERLYEICSTKYECRN